MKRIVVVLGVTALLVAVIAGPVSARAVTETYKNTFYLSNAVYDCEGGEVVVESVARQVDHTTTDPNGGVHSFFTFTLQGVTATDANGETVRFLVHDYEGSTNVIEDPSTGTITQTYRIISSGPSDNRLLTTFIHVTVNANGEVTSYSFDQTIECHG
jgi:hypothetical protein